MRQVFSFGKYKDDPEPWREGIGFFKSILEIIAGVLIVLLFLVVWYACKVYPSD
jgi:hypothetical protein